MMIDKLFCCFASVCIWICEFCCDIFWVAAICISVFVYFDDEERKGKNGFVLSAVMYFLMMKGRRRNGLCFLL